MKVIVKGSERNHPVCRRELGDVVQMIVREHGVEDGWSAFMTHSWNKEHGSHTVITFEGLSRPLDPQRLVVLV